jgi:hypothetical protein
MFETAGCLFSRDFNPLPLRGFTRPRRPVDRGKDDRLVIRSLCDDESLDCQGVVPIEEYANAGFYNKRFSFRDYNAVRDDGFTVQDISVFFLVEGQGGNVLSRNEKKTDGDDDGGGPQ